VHENGLPGVLRDVYLLCCLVEQGTEEECGYCYGFLYYWEPRMSTGITHPTRVVSFSTSDR
jgi:hypothetical protein